MCAVCSEVVAKETGYSTGFLTSDSSHPLFAFNYTTLHKDHLRQWSKYEEFERLVADFVASGLYAGPPILPSTEPFVTPMYRMGRAYKIGKE